MEHCEPPEQGLAHPRLVALQQMNGVRPVMAAAPAGDTICAAGIGLAGKWRQAHENGHC